MSKATVKSIAERRVRRQKITIAVGSVVLLAVLGFEVPKILGGHGNSGAIEAVTTIAPTAAGTTPVAPVGTLPNTDRVVVVRGSNQLISFGLFKSKDPFVPQLTTSATDTTQAPASTPPASTTPTGTTATSGGSNPVVVPGSPTAPSGSPSVTPATTTPGTTTPTTPPPVPTAALISTNGICEQVSVKGTFPASENIFRLVSIAKDGKSVQIGIVGGSFDSGQPTATLKLGDKITLVNTADGTRYVIKLETKCSTVATPSGTTTPAQQTPTTPIAPTPSTTETTTTTPTTTTTTPIVTDSLDTSTPTG